RFAGRERFATEGEIARQRVEEERSVAHRARGPSRNPRMRQKPRAVRVHSRPEPRLEEGSGARENGVLVRGIAGELEELAALGHEVLRAILLRPRRGPRTRVREDARAPASAGEVFEAGVHAPGWKSDHPKTRPAARAVARDEAFGIDRVASEETHALDRDPMPLERFPHGEEGGAAHPGTLVHDEELAVARALLGGFPEPPRELERAIPRVARGAHREALRGEAALRERRPNDRREARADTADADDEHPAAQRERKGGRERREGRGIERI